mmetsp:Transcript_18587/g.51880  ORF Transcript_18587/g.51880 Transcript_18587/m.51880 type:complete len:300 (+) Transcript_18587:133-1032(+)
MANPFINSSFTLRPAINNRDKPELTLRQTEMSRVPKENTAFKEGRAYKRQRLFMDRFESTTFPTGYRYSYYDDDSTNNDQYISDEEELADTSITQRSISTQFPLHDRINGGSGEMDSWKTRCLGIQDMFDRSQVRLREAEEDQRQLRQRIRELEEQLLLQSSCRKKGNGIGIGKLEGEVNNVGEAFRTENWENDNYIEGKNYRVELNHNGGGGAQCKEDLNHKSRKERNLPALVVEIKENHQAVSSCFYLTDGEGLNESYDQDMEDDDEDIAMDVHNSEGMLDDIDDDRNDINLNQRRG